MRSHSQSPRLAGGHAPGAVLRKDSIVGIMLGSVCENTSAGILGEVAERSKAAVLKTVEGLRLPRVRIPASPPAASNTAVTSAV